MIKKLKVVHLDDHTLFQEGVQRCLDPKKEKLFIQKFQYSEDAYLYIKNSLDNRHTIDLILTDFTHMGDNGYDFAKSVRLYESSFSVRIPILLLTMHLWKTK